MAITTTVRGSAGGDEPWTAWTALDRNARNGRTTTLPRLDDAAASVSLWEEPEMRHALAAREISQVYRLLRRQKVKQRDIARMTGQSQSEVSEILKGRQVMAYDVLLRIADGLGVPRGYMGLAYNEVSAARIATPAAEEDSIGERARRRKFLAHAAAVDVGSFASGTTVTPIVAAPVEAELFQIREVREVVRTLRVLSRDHGVDACRYPVLTELARVRHLLDAVRSDRARAELRRAVTALEQMASDEQRIWGTAVEVPR